MVDNRAALRRQVSIAQAAQQRRAEAQGLGYREETQAFYGSDKVAPAEHAERRLTMADADAEARALAQHEREQARAYRELLAHGYAGMSPQQVFERVLEHSGDAWKASALRGIAALAATGRVFQASDVLRFDVSEPDHPNRWGAVFYAAARGGLIQPAGYSRSKRPATRSSILRVWRGAKGKP